MTNPSTGNSVGAPTTHTLTITNDDGPAPTAAFTTAVGTQAEGNTGTSIYTVNVTLTGTLPTGTFTVPVSVDLTNSTATAGSDYTLNTTSLPFSATATTQPVTITVAGDVIYEPSETVRLRLGVPSDPNIIVGSPSAHVFTIVNDDAAPTGAPCGKRYFSQYIESNTGNTKVVEIYNPTSGAVSLNGKRVVLYSNGASTTPTFSQALAGTIAAGDVHVIANTNVTDPGGKAQTDLESSVAFFNGDDALALFDGTDTLDVIGVIGQRPTKWKVAAGTAPTARPSGPATTSITSSA